MPAIWETPCPVCGELLLRIEMRLRAKPIGSFSLSGQTMKFSALSWPYLVCEGCGVSGPAKSPEWGDD